MKTKALILLIYTFIHLEAIHVQFKQYKFSHNFFAPAATTFNKIIPDCLPGFKMTIVNQNEDIWWYVRDLVVYIKIVWIIVIAILSYTITKANKYILGMLFTICIFALIEVWEYIFFKNIFEMYVYNWIATAAILILNGLYIYDTRNNKC